MMVSRAVLTVSVYRIETPVLSATILPNLAKGAMMQKKRGTVAMTVVRALETMATPTCRTASRVRHWRWEWASWERVRAEAGVGDMTHDSRTLPCLGLGLGEHAAPAEASPALGSPQLCLGKWADSCTSSTGVWGDEMVSPQQLTAHSGRPHALMLP